MLDEDLCYRAVSSRDPRFDGAFVTAVTSTGIYCRPSCPATTPRRRNVRFYRTSAAAQGAGFRACRRCLPDATPGSPEWNVRADLVGRAMRLIADGVVDRDGVSGLAARLGYSERHVHRQLLGEVGAGPQALARAQRAQTARLLLETTELPVSDVAFAAGFASIRQFNDTVRTVFASTPGDLRRSRPGRTLTGPAAGGVLTLRLPYREPFAAPALFAFLGARAVPGVEETVEGTYRRALALPHGGAVVELTPADRHVWARLRLADLRDLGSAVQRCRRLLDLDADPAAVDAHLGADPLLSARVAAVPGRRVPGAVDGVELAVRAVLGQQVSVAGARTLAGRLTARFGEPLEVADGGLTRRFPAPAALAAADPAELPLPKARARALTALAGRLADGSLPLDPGVDRDATEAALRALPGLGPWTAAYVRMRALGDPDVLLLTDLAVRRALSAVGAEGSDFRRWRPWRSYATLHLWRS